MILFEFWCDGVAEYVLDKRKDIILITALNYHLFATALRAWKLENDKPPTCIKDRNLGFPVPTDEEFLYMIMSAKVIE